MKKKLHLAFALIVLSVSALVGAENANATSVYDNLVQSVDEGFIYGQTYNGSGSCSTIEMTYKWHEVLTGQSTLSNEDETPINHMGTGWSSVFTSFENRVYTAVSFYKYSNEYSAMWVTWTDWPMAESNFTTVSGSQRLTAETPGFSNTYQVLVEYNSSCELKISEPMSVSSTIITDNPTDTTVLFNQFPINYPEGYEGVDMNETPPTAAIQSDWVPQFHVSIANDWKASIHDTNFNTFDSNPFLCGGEFAPILHYEIWDTTLEDEVLLYTAYNSATVQIDYQFEKKPTSQNFRIIGWYECAPEDNMEFTESNYKDFTINGQGDLFISGLETCVTAEFPFLNWNSCVVGMNSLLATLAFNFANPTNQGITNVAAANPNNCYQLGTLGDWIGRPNQVVCAAFSTEVRNTITPFVTFVLGAVVFMYISRSKATVIS